MPTAIWQSSVETERLHMSSTQPLMHIVVDTEVIYSDFWLKKANFATLLSNLHRVGWALHLPTVVLEEIENKFRHELAKATNAAAKELRHSATLLDDRDLKSPLHDLDVQSEVKRYRRHLEEHLRKHGVRSLSVPNVSHADILQRAIAKRKPFNESGKGYRDTLIWYATLELYRQTDVPVYLVTGNTKDFGANNQFANDLLDDIRDSGCGPIDRLRLLNRLDDLVTGVLMPRIESLEDVEQQVEKGTFLEKVAWDDDWLDIELDMACREFVEHGEGVFGFITSDPFCSHEEIAFDVVERHSENAVQTTKNQAVLDIHEDRDVDGFTHESNDVVRIRWSAKARFHFRCVFNTADRTFETSELREVDLLSGPDVRNESVRID
jgi:hypothetical protein